MDSIQEALRELMRRTKDNKKTTTRAVAGKQIIKEELSISGKGERIFDDLWDQVYCTLVDVGDNRHYEICGGKGKYERQDVGLAKEEGKYGNQILRVSFNKNNGKVTEEKFFAEAKKVAEKFGLKTERKERRNYVFFDIFVPEDEGVYFDLIPVKYRKRIARETGEDLDMLPVSPSYKGGPLAIEIKKAPIRAAVTQDVKGSVDAKEENEPQIPVELARRKAVTEKLSVPLPVNILPESEVLAFIDAVPKATSGRGPASLVFTVGYITDVPVASQFSGGKGSVNKETGETLPVVDIVKCSETSRVYLEEYRSSKKTIAHMKQKARFAAQAEQGGDEPEAKTEIPNWSEAVPEHRGLLKNKNTGQLFIRPLLSTNSRTKVKYFISIDGSALRPAAKDEILPYLTPAKQAELVNGRTAVKKTGPDGEEIIDAAQPLNLYLSKIYRIADKGHSIF